jgi:hypothetical protein
VSDVEKRLDKMLNITNEILISLMTKQLAERDELILELSDKVDFYADTNNWYILYDGRPLSDDNYCIFNDDSFVMGSGESGGKLARTPLKNQKLLDEIKGRV